MNKDFQDRIDDYILGRMSAEEALRFKKELVGDESKRRQYEFTLNVKNAVSSRQEKLARMDEMQKRYNFKKYGSQFSHSVSVGNRDSVHVMPSPSYNAAPPVKKKKTGMKWWISGGIAILVLGLFVINPFNWGTKLEQDDLLRGSDDDIFYYQAPTAEDSTIVTEGVQDTLDQINGELNKDE